MITYTLQEWRNIAEPMFGKDVKNWQFKCPTCGHVQTMNDFKEAGVDEPETKFYYSCIGRWKIGTGCNWTLGGLFRIHKTEVISEDGSCIPVFEFATPTPQN